MQRISRVAGLLTCYALILTNSVSAQLVRPSNSLFIRPSFGFVNYLGDNNDNLLELGVKGQLEVGYQIFSSLGVSALYNYGEYTEVLRPNINTGLARSTGNTRLSNAQLLVRYTIGRDTWELAPYVHAGAGVAFGGDQPEDEPGWGPVLGAGLDIMVSRNVSFFFEATSNFSLPDAAVDGPNRGLFADHDLLTRYSLGLSINFSSRAFVPVDVTRINAPTTLEVDEIGTFVARGNMGQASSPVEYMWDFGDGETSPLVRATHSFSRPGTYAVTFRAENEGNTDFETVNVIVTPKDAAPVIVAMNSNPVNPNTETTVSFDANVLGNDPLEYLWRFEDGETSTVPFPSRVFEKPGVHNVELTVTNQLGSDMQSILVNVAPYEASFCEETAEMSAVYFARQSSVLSDEARFTLDENLQILSECPNITVRIDGFAVAGERDTEGLSQDRARAVENYYVRNGVAQSRILTLGRGQVGLGLQKDGSAQYRRAETLVTGQ